MLAFCPCSALLGWLWTPCCSVETWATSESNLFQSHWWGGVWWCMTEACVDAMGWPIMVAISAVWRSIIAILNFLSSLWSLGLLPIFTPPLLFHLLLMILPLLLVAYSLPFLYGLHLPLTSLVDACNSATNCFVFASLPVLLLRFFFCLSYLIHNNKRENTKIHGLTYYYRNVMQIIPIGTNDDKDLFSGSMKSSLIL